MPISGGKADARGREHGLQFGAVEIGGGEAAGGPDEGGDAGDDVGHARRAAAQRLQDLADAGAVVIGGAARRRLVGRPSCRLRLLVEQVGGDRRLALRGRCGGRRGRRVARSLGGRMLSASWMAESASSVGSLDFCGMFAISVVASLLRRTIAAARTVTISGPRHERGNLRSRGLPRMHPFYRSAFILSPWQCERNRAGKEFFIIVN